MADYQSYPVLDLSGGITENIEAGIPNKAEIIDNMLVVDGGGLKVRPGSILWDTTINRLTSSATVSSIIVEDTDLLINSGKNIYLVKTTPSIAELVGPTSNAAFAAGTAGTNYVDYAKWRDHYFIVSDGGSKPVKLYKDGSANWQLRTAGLPALASAPTVTAGAAGTNNYIYAFVYYYTYAVGTVTYEDFGAVTQVPLVSSNQPSDNTVAITAIPELANSTTNNYATTVIKVKIYRTVNAGTAFYYVGEVTNGTATYSDTSSDASISAANIQLYTNGSAVENDTPPPARFIEIVNGVGYYGYVTEGSEVKGFRLRQSVPDDPDSVPGSFYYDFDEVITGVSSINSIPIVFTKTKHYRLEGIFDVLGRGSIKAYVIGNSVGCVSHNSIIAGAGGLYFAGNGGFYFTDGYQTTKISEDFNKTYQKIVSIEARGKRVYGTYDRVNRHVYWACQKNDDSLANDSCFIFHERFGVKPDATFTTFSGGASFNPTAIVFDNNGDLLRGDKNGYFFKHNDDYRSDPRIEVGLPTGSWTDQAIIWNYVSSQLDCGLADIRKYGARIMLLFKNLSNLSAQPRVSSDGYSLFKDTAPIRTRDQLRWGTEWIRWYSTTDPQFKWRFNKDIVHGRFCPRGNLRFYRRQLQMTNAFVVIQKSDVLGTASIDATAKTITLNNASYTWLAVCGGHYISLSTDGYVKNYFITARTDNHTLTLADPDGDLVTGTTYEWVMRGYPKDELVHFVGFVLFYLPFTDNFKDFGATDGGGNTE